MKNSNTFTILKHFRPLTGIYGILGTSYGIQMGKIGEKWAVIIKKGKDILAYKNFEGLNVPNGKYITQFIISNTLPGINPYQIMQTVQFIRQSIKIKEDRT
jgi:hypothetical protein